MEKHSYLAVTYGTGERHRKSKDRDDQTDIHRALRQVSEELHHRIRAEQTVPQRDWTRRFQEA